MQDTEVQELVRESIGLYHRGDCENAIAAMTTLCQCTRRPDAYAVLARMQSERGRIDEAIKTLRESAAIQRSARTLSNLGMLLLSENRDQEALLALREALTIEPTFPEALSNLGVALRSLRQSSEAIQVLQQATALKPDFASAWSNLAGVFLDLERYADAESASRKAVTLAPNDPVAHYNLGTSLKDMGRLDEAFAALRLALTLRPNYVDALTNLGNVLHQQGQYESAISIFHQALHLSPSDAFAQWNLSLTLLTLGRYAEAWPLYQSRFRLPKLVIERHFSQPQWNGGDLRGKTILLHFEQGLGDTLQFVRYAPILVTRGARVLLLCQPTLERLLQGQCGIDFVTSDENALPPFDVHCPLPSLPGLLGTTIDTIPAPHAYLRANSELTRLWQNRLGAAQDLRVGLNWAGSPIPVSNRKRTIGLSPMVPLTQLDGVTFYSLQAGPAAAEATTPPAGMKLIDCSKFLKDYSETAALISSLDVVVTCDTSVAHAAGALGKPTCVILPSDPDWRWMANRSDSPWYPTMRLFRQPTPGDYATPIRQVVDYLRAFRDRDANASVSR